MIPQAQLHAPPPVPIALSKVLLVEGNTPLHFFEAFLRHLGISGQIEVRKFEGVDRLRSELKALAATAEFNQVRSLGIVRDAEHDAQAAARSVQAALVAAGMTGGRSPQIQCSVFILPDNGRAGMIETLLVESICNEPVFPCIERFFECVEQTGIKLPSGEVRAKSVSQAYLATRDDVQMFRGTAAYRGFWPWDNAAFDALRQFLQGL